MALNQRDSDFFRPLWRRVVLTAAVTAWFCYESFVSHDQLWIAITAAAVAYSVWNFFLRFPKDPPGSTGGGTPPAASSGPPDTSDGAPKA
jgi:hypothetical protein